MYRVRGAPRRFFSGIPPQSTQCPRDSSGHRQHASCLNREQCDGRPRATGLDCRPNPRSRQRHSGDDANDRPAAAPGLSSDQRPLDRIRCNAPLLLVELVVERGAVHAHLHILDMRNQGTVGSLHTCPSVPELLVNGTQGLGLFFRHSRPALANPLNVTRPTAATAHF